MTVADTPVKELWDDAEFNSERAKTLVLNLRAEVAQVKQELQNVRGQFADASAQLTQITSEKTGLESELAEKIKILEQRDGEIREATKLQILAKHKLPENLVAALTGEDSTAWEEMASMIAAIAGNKATDESSSFQPDPVQSANETPSGDAQEIAHMRAMGLI